jgi:hypothetical protein
VAVNRSLGPEGPTNDELILIRLDDADGRPAAVLLSYACHPVNLHSTGLITPDFPYYIEQDIARALGRRVALFYLSGAGGDLNPANFDRERTEAKAAQTAGKISGKALELLPSIKTAPQAVLGCAASEVSVPLQPLPSKQELAAMIDENERKMAVAPDKSPTDWNYCGLKTRVEWAREAIQTIEAGRVRTAQTIPLQGFRIGDAALIGMPGEPFTEFGLSVRRSGLLPFPFVVSLANGCFGYFPSRRAFEKNTYEAAGCPRYVGLYFFQQNVGELVCEGAMQLLRKLAHGGHSTNSG